MPTSKIVTASITDDAVTIAKSTGLVRPNANPIIINGNMGVAQRATSATGITGSGYYVCDRWKETTSMGTWASTQEAQTSGNAFLNGFRTAYRIDCTTADASPGAATGKWFVTYLEGQNLQEFKKGGANAEKWTLAFWVKSNKTGTGQVNLVDKDNSRMCGATYTISSANTWEHKVCNYAADTTGAFDNDNARSLDIEWSLDAGSNFTSGTVPTAWETTNNADRAVNDFALADNTANDWAITGIQLEVGEFNSSTLPPFQHESYGDNLRRCQRYYSRPIDGDSQGICTAAAYNTNDGFGIYLFPVRMRSAPSLVTTNGTNYYKFVGNNTSVNFDGPLVISTATESSGQLAFSSFSGALTQNMGGAFRTGSASASLAFSSEL